MYDVVLLIERALTDLDVRQVVSLHEGLDEAVTYHLLLPVEDAAGQLATSMGAVGGVDMLSTPDAREFDDVQRSATETGRRGLDASRTLMQAQGQAVTTQLTSDDPITALAALVAEHSAAEAIILTEPHIVSEFFHLDWTSRARRKLDVPTLHLLEHETFDGQSSGGGEGVSII
ncbi:MAG: hypothetical protein WKF83_11440 [Nocardioidaceae bacterium]